MENMCSITNQITNNWMDFIIMLATIFMAWIAWKALSTWKDQKDHELRIEIFANSRRALEMIKSLRNPVSVEGEITDEVIEERNRITNHLPDADEQNFMVFLSRANRLDGTYQQFLVLREKIWAEYEEKHIFYQFYDYIIKTNLELSHAHKLYVSIRDRNSFNTKEDKEERRRLKLITISMKDDPINKKLDELFEKLEEERRKYKKSS